MSVLKRAAVVGLGGQAQDDHLPGLADCQFAELVAVCDTDPDRAAAQGRAYRVPGYTDLTTLLKEVRPDFVIAAVPHHAGREVIEACAAAGVHVMKEKPFATHPAEGAELAGLCATAGIELMVTVQRRFHPIYTAALQLLEQIGPPYLVEGRYTFHCADPAAGWRGSAKLAGGGALVDMGYHLIDLLIWYLGLPDRVLADTSAAAAPGAAPATPAPSPPPNEPRAAPGPRHPPPAVASRFMNRFNCHSRVSPRRDHATIGSSRERVDSPPCWKRCFAEPPSR
ncbi:Gfo/Idh/MocA family protein [Streptomyces sp. NPDC058961]|uniref:Gfo/Idh/MocA family protein n=1 Tax=Streptomyces sp. NPDC058961 TaxID=3346680 RepID=UPI00368B2BA0